MIRRVSSCLLFLMMLNALAVGDGLFSIGGSSSCDRRMQEMGVSKEMPDMSGMNVDHSLTHGSQESRAPLKTGCNLPWSPGCASAAPCAPAAMISIVSTVILASPKSG